MRAPEEQLERAICVEHCRYFKPWQEPGRCAAFGWILGRIRTDPRLREALERLRGARPIRRLRHDSVLLRSVCIRCDHYPYRCALRHPQKAGRAEPCGGLIALDMLLERGALSDEDVFDPGGRSWPAGP